MEIACVQIPTPFSRWNLGTDMLAFLGRSAQMIFTLNRLNDINTGISTHQQRRPDFGNMRNITFSCNSAAAILKGFSSFVPGNGFAAASCSQTGVYVFILNWKTHALASLGISWIKRRQRNTLPIQRV